mgnify:CR=1 FL=1
MKLPTISPITKTQWISVAKNAVIAGVSAFAVSLQASGDVSKPVLISAAVAFVTAAVKTIEKAFTTN